MPIPRAVVEQEAEIESIFRDLIRFSDSAFLQHCRHRADRAQEQQIGAWILIVALVLISIIGFYLLGREFDVFGITARPG